MGGIPDEGDTGHVTGAYRAGYDFDPERLPDIVFRFRLRPSLRFDYISDACEAITGYTPKDHYRDPALAIQQVHPADMAQMVMLTSAPESAPSPTTMRWITRDGTVRPMELSFSLVTNGDGTVVAIEGIARDVSARVEREEMLRRWVKQMEERAARLEECTRAQARLLGDLVHEVRSPLTAIMGFADLMIDGKLGPLATRHQDIMRRISSGAEHLLGVVRDSLALAAASAGKMQFEPEDVDPVELVREVSALLEATSLERDIWVEVDGRAWTGTIVTDRQRFKQVVCNYLSNALKFSPTGGIVSVRIAPAPGGCVRVEVEDAGPGIRADDLGRLFVEFQQLDLARAHEGSGLGLALTKRIVEAMGGAVGVESEPGRGSLFYAVVPPLMTSGAQSTSDAATAP